MAVAGTYDIALFDSKTDNRPKARTVSLEALLKGFTKFDVRPDKDGHLWSPAKYIDGADRRSNANVATVNALVLDFDNGLAPDDFYNAWSEWTFAVHSTFSSTNEFPKWRAVFPLSKPVAAADFERVYAKLALSIGCGAVDPACKDISRMYYLPAHPEGAVPFSHLNNGRLLDPDEIPDTEPDEPPDVVAYSTRIRPGDDFEQKVSWEEVLEKHGWVRSRRGYDGMTLWTRPGKDPHKGASARTGPGKQGDRFYCWSSEAGVPCRKLLTKFSLLAHLEFGGDHKACADSLRAKGYGAQQIEPPSVVSEVVEGRPQRFNLTDLGNAERFIAMHGENLRYCHLWGRWLFWDGRRWKVDVTGGATAYSMAYAMVRGMQKEAADSDDEDLRKALGPWAHKCETRSRIENIVAMAKTFPQVNVTPDDLDAHPNLLNLANGTYDLKTGEQKAHDRRQLLTKAIDISYSDSADCPVWIGFLSRVLAGDESLMRFIFKALGYSLTGNTSEQAFFFLHGTQGNNGKSTFVETMLRVLGEYGNQTTTDTLMAKQGDSGINNDIADLKGARFVASPETQEGKRLNEQLIKSLTGGDTIKARFLYQENFSFTPQFKIWMTGNHKPVIRGTDDAIWRRVLMIPFSVTIPEKERDPELKEKFWEEREGILSWLIDGCKIWKSERLGRPEVILEAISGYREEMDILGSYLDECTVADVNAEVKASVLYGDYEKWCKRNNEYCMSQKKFGQAMASRGEASSRTKSSNVYHGRRLVEEEKQDHVWRGSSD